MNQALRQVNTAATRLSELRSRHYAALLEGDEDEADRVIARARQDGTPLFEIYLGILVANQIEIGEAWHRRQIHTADEHQSTQIVLNQMNRLRSDIRPRIIIPVHVVITSVEGEWHFVGPRLAADFLAVEGWQVHHLGPNTPAADLCQFVQDRSIGLVGLSITLSENLGAGRRTVAMLKALPNPPQVVIGGAATRGGDDLGADAVCNDLLVFSSLAKRLLGLEAKRHTVDEYLKMVGMRINALRKEKGISQQQLADGASLNRVYISAVENGKENISIGALCRIADALEIPIADLLKPDLAAIY
jgi:MerR family transcriptional regulator, light-induced transcriptional regulator